MIPRILLDTDIGEDCDDAGALALLNVLALRGEAEMVAVTSATSRRWAPACIASINQYYGTDAVPIGMMEMPGFLDGPGTDVYAEKAARHFGHTKPLADVEGALRVMRRTLAATTEKIRLVLIGPLKNADNLLNSSADDLSPLSGEKLLRSQVEEVVIMGGVFNPPPPNEEEPTTVEYNIGNDVSSAQHFIHNCPVPLVFIDSYLGRRVKTGKLLTDAGDMGHPVTFIYNTHGSPVRSSWDPVTVLYAVRGLADCWAVSAPGMVTVTDDGRTVFTPVPEGKHRYLQEKLPPEKVAEIMDVLLTFKPIKRR